MKIELEKEEVDQIMALMQNSTVPISQAEMAVKLYNKFKEAK